MTVDEKGAVSGIKNFTGAVAAGGQSAVGSMQKIQSATNTVGTGLTKLGTIFTAVGAGFALVINRAVDFAGNLSEISQSASVSVETLSALDLVAQQNNASFEDLTTGLKFLNKNMVEAITGNKDVAEAFGIMGVSVTDASGKLRATDAVLGDLAVAFSKMPEGPEKVRAALLLLGRAGDTLIPTLNSIGKEGLENIIIKAREAGHVISNETAAAADKFGDTMLEVKKTIVDVALSLAKEIIPQLQSFAEKAIAAGKAAIAFFNSLPAPVKAAAADFALFAAALGPVLLGLGFFAKSISSILALLPALQAGLAAIGIASGPVGLAVAAVVVGLGALIAMMIKVRAEGQAAVEKIKEQGEAHKALNSVLSGESIDSIDGWETKIKSAIENQNIIKDGTKEWTVDLKGLRAELEKTGTVLPKVVGGMEDAGVAIHFLGEEEKLAKEEAKKLVEQFNKAIKPANDLAKEIELLRKNGASSAEIIEIYAEKIQAATGTHIALNKQIPATISSIDKERIAMATNLAATLKLIDGMTAEWFERGKLIERVDGLNKAMDRERATIDLLAARRSFLTAGINDMQTAVEGAKAAIDQEVAAQKEAYDEGINNIEMNDSLADSLKNQVSTAITDTSRAIAESIVQFKSFGETGLKIVKDLATGILQTLIERAIKPLIEWIDGLIMKLVSMSNAAGGVGGSFGGLLSSLGPQGIFGIGIAGAGLTAGSMIGGTAGKFIGGAAGGLGVGMAFGNMLGLGSMGGPIGAAIGAAIAGIAVLIGSFGKGRKEADKIVPVQNKVTESLAELMSALRGLHEAGTLTADGVAQAREKILQIREQFFDFTQDFERAGPGARATIGGLIDTLLTEVDAMGSEAEEAASSLALLAGRMTEIDTELASLIAEYDASTIALSGYHSELEDIKDALGQSTPEQISYADAIRQTAAEAQAAAAAVISTQNQIRGLERQVAIDRLQSLVETAGSAEEAKEAQEKLRQLQDQFTKEDRAAREAELAKLKEELPKLQAAAEAAKLAEIAAKEAGQQRIDKLNELIGVETENLVRLKDRIDALVDERAALEDIIASVRTLADAAAALARYREQFPQPAPAEPTSTSIQEFQHGGISDRLQLALLHPREAVIPIDRLMAALEKSSGKQVKAVVVLDGKVLAEALVPAVAEDVDRDRYGMRTATQRAAKEAAKK